MIQLHQMQRHSSTQWIRGSIIHHLHFRTWCCTSFLSYSIDYSFIGWRDCSEHGRLQSNRLTSQGANFKLHFHFHYCLLGWWQCCHLSFRGHCYSCFASSLIKDSDSFIVGSDQQGEWWLRQYSSWDSLPAAKDCEHCCSWLRCWRSQCFGSEPSVLIAGFVVCCPDFQHFSFACWLMCCLKCLCYERVCCQIEIGCRCLGRLRYFDCLASCRTTTDYSIP